jgi:hypothetical protein
LELVPESEEVLLVVFCKGLFEGFDGFSRHSWVSRAIFFRKGR